MLARLGLWVTLGTLGAGCAGLRHAACPEQGGAPWVEARSAHFRVRTDLPPEDAQRVTRDLEAHRRAILMAWGAALDPEVTLEAVVVRNHFELEALTGDRFGKVTFDYGPLLMVMTGGEQGSGAYEQARTRNFHVAYHLSAYALLRRPRWVAQGVAAFLSTAAVENGQAVLGRPVAPFKAFLARYKPMSLPELRGWSHEGSGELDERGNASAWAWVHFLSNKYPERFGAFQRALGQAEDPDEAWAAAFAGVSDERLFGELDENLKQDYYGMLRVPMPEVPQAVALRPMAEDEVHATRAQLAGLRPADKGREEAMSAEWTEALRLRADSPSAWLVRARHTPSRKRAEEYARKAVTADPQLGDAWYVLGESLLKARDGARDDAEKERLLGEAEAALRHAAQAAPDHARALTALAFTQQARGAHPEAFALATRAAQLAPFDPNALETYAFSAANAGKCEETVRAGQRAADLLDAPGNAQVRDALRQRVDGYAKACFAAGPSL